MAALFFALGFGLDSAAQAQPSGRKRNSRMRILYMAGEFGSSVFRPSNDEKQSRRTTPSTMTRRDTVAGGTGVGQIDKRNNQHRILLRADG